MTADQYLGQQTGCSLETSKLSVCSSNIPSFFKPPCKEKKNFKQSLAGNPVPYQKVFACIRSGMSTLCMQRSEICLPAEEEITEVPALESQLTAGFAEEFGYQDMNLKSSCCGLLCVALMFQSNWPERPQKVSEDRISMVQCF